MSYSPDYAPREPTRDEIDATRAPLVLEFGSPGCGYCRGAQPLLEDALAERPDVSHLKIEDGRGRRLGRSFGVKLWPTLVFLRDGVEVARVIRPADVKSIRDALALIE